jgi:hypothetical protein
MEARLLQYGWLGWGVAGLGGFSVRCPDGLEGVGQRPPTTGPEQTRGPRHTHNGQPLYRASHRRGHPVGSPIMRQGSGRCLWSIQPIH